MIHSQAEPPLRAPRLNCPHENKALCAPLICGPVDERINTATPVHPSTKHHANTQRPSRYRSISICYAEIRLFVWPDQSPDVNEDPPTPLHYQCYCGKNIDRKRLLCCQLGNNKQYKGLRRCFPHRVITDGMEAPRLVDFSPIGLLLPALIPEAHMAP